MVLYGHKSGGPNVSVSRTTQVGRRWVPATLRICQLYFTEREGMTVCLWMYRVGVPQETLLLGLSTCSVERGKQFQKNLNRVITKRQKSYIYT